MFLVKLVDTVFCIHNHYEEIKELCKDYIVESNALDHIDIITITTTEEEILIEDVNQEGFRKSYLETLAVYRKIATYFATKSVLLMHGSCIAYQNQGVLFSAPSGTGKSTHVRLWQEVFQDEITIVNDDKPLVSAGLEVPMIYGTPWAGKHSLQRNIAVPLKAIVILQRGAENKIEKIGQMDGFVYMMKQVFRPEDSALVSNVTRLLYDMLGKIEVYKMSCNMSKEAAMVACEGIFGA